MTPLRRTWALTALVLTLALAACDEMSSDPDNTDDGNRAPTLNLTASPTTGVAPYSAVLSANADDPDGDDLTYVWTTSEGRVVSGAQFSLTLPTPGSYAVSVTVSDGALDATESLTLNATAAESVPGNEPPTVDLELSVGSGPAPLTVRLEATARDPDGDDLKLLWSFGDGTAATSGGVQNHTYEEPGTYRARVTVSDGRGGTATATGTITVSGGDDDGGDDGGENDDGEDDGNDGGDELATFVIDVSPEEARWALYPADDPGADDPPFGYGDAELDLEAGQYDLYVTAEAYRTAERQVTLEAGQTTTASVTLEAEVEVEVEAVLDFGYNDGGSWFVEQGGTLEVAVGTAEGQFDVGESGFGGLTFSLEGGGAFTPTLLRSFVNDEGRVFVYETTFGPALNEQELGYTPSVTSPYNVNFIEEVNMLFFVPTE